jgi:hypothetical protein
MREVREREGAGLVGRLAAVLESTVPTTHVGNLIARFHPISPRAQLGDRRLSAAVAREGCLSRDPIKVDVRSATGEKDEGREEAHAERLAH